MEPAALSTLSGIPRTTLVRYLELLVFMELARQLTWSEERGRLYHYRNLASRVITRS